MGVKNYRQIKGSCEDCTLLFNCNQNKKGIKEFLGKLEIICVDGFCLEVVESE